MFSEIGGASPPPVGQKGGIEDAMASGGSRGERGALKEDELQATCGVPGL